MSVQRIASQWYWRGSNEEAYRLDEDFLVLWNYLKRTGVSDIKPIKCEARNCVTFTAGGENSCGAFTHWSGQLSSRNDTDLLGGYYCAGRHLDVTSENLNMVFASLAIRGKAGGYVKRATTDGAVEQQQDSESDLSSQAEQSAVGAQLAPAQVEAAEIETSEISERLRKVKQLLAEVLITEAEAAEKRKAILD